MTIDVTEPGSDGWVLNRLLRKLGEEAPRFEMLDTYYRGENGIPISADKAARQAIRRLLAMSRSNFAELVVEAVQERMVPIGFRTGATSDALGDDAAWAMWQASSLDADKSVVHRKWGAMGKSYVIVGDVDDDTGLPLITPEDPREVIAETDPARPRKVLWALKAFHDDVMGVDVAYLYLPGRVLTAMRPHAAQVANGVGVNSAEGFEWVDEQTFPIRQVPVVRFASQPRGRCWGEYEPHLSILDRINYGLLQRLEIAALQAFRQRAVKNLPPRDPEGQPVDYTDICTGEPGALWALPNGVEIWESAQVDLGPLRLAIRDDVQDLAAATRVPLFYLTPEAANGSAEGASLAREGLIAKVKDRIVQASESWEQVMSLAFAVAGDEERARRSDMQVMWANPEHFTLAEQYDAATKAQTIGVPWRSIMADILQKTPQEIDRMEQERISDLLTLVPQPASGIPAAP